jgi:hypothetical protein
MKKEILATSHALGGRMGRAGKTVIVLILGYLVCFGIVLPQACADDFTQTFSITSPRHVDHMAYERQDPPFVILAPEGWFMASRRPDAPSGSIGVFFFKEDPTPEGKKGNLVKPYIRIDFYRNQDIPSAIAYARQAVESLKKAGIKILAEAEEFEAAGETAGHFTTQGDMAGGEETIDNYVFVDPYRVIMISAVCRPAELEETRKAVRASVHSITFSTVLTR